MHPIFDSLTYPWHIKEADNFYRVLCTAYTVNDAIEKFYKACGPYITFLPALINIDLSPSDKLWRDALEKLAQKNCIKNLCDALEKDGPVQEVADAMQAVINALSAVDPRVIDSNLLTLDRKPLRECLELLSKVNDPVKVLLVRGGPKSGKTYSRHLFEAMAKQQGAGMVFLHSYVVVTLSDALNDLFMAVSDKTDIPEGDTTQPGWYSKICRELLAQAKINNRFIWIAIDDLGFTPDGVPIMDAEIRDFFNQFVRHMSSPDFRRHFKLMLINYPPGKLPAGWYKEHLKEDSVDEGNIKQVHLEEHIRNWCAANNKGIHENEIVSQAARIIAEVDMPGGNPDNIPRLERINDLINKFLGNI